MLDPLGLFAGRPATRPSRRRRATSSSRIRTRSAASRDRTSVAPARSGSSGRRPAISRAGASSSRRARRRARRKRRSTRCAHVAGRWSTTSAGRSAGARARALPLGRTGLRRARRRDARASSRGSRQPEDDIGAAVLTNAGAARRPEVRARPAVAAIELCPPATEAWQPGEQPPAGARAAARPLVDGGQRVRVLLARGPARGRAGRGPGRDVSCLEPDGDDRWRVVEGRERGEQLRVVRDAVGGS